MADRPDNTLDYAPKPSRWAGFFAIRRRTWIKLAVVGLVCFAGFSLVFGPTSGQIRLDTGDLRYCWWGVPLSYRQMPEPQRSKLLALAAKSPAIPARWVTCVTYPLTGKNIPDLMDRDFYWAIAIWSHEDAKIARWAMEEVADYIQHAKRGYPESCLVLECFMDWHAKKVNANWRDQDEVKAYCLTHGYVPPPAPSASRP